MTTLIVRNLGTQHYLDMWDAMRAFTNARTEYTLDECWLLEHNPVFTQGQNGKSEHLLDPGNIPVIQTDRGGQITYHGPGQLMMYSLVDLKRKKMNVRQLVNALEQTVIHLLQEFNINAYAKCDAPGVYVTDEQTKKTEKIEKKICSIGLRIRKGCSYHGIAFNIQMDLTPFKCINPCGFKSLQMTQLSDYTNLSLKETGGKLINYFAKNLRYTTVHSIS